MLTFVWSVEKQKGLTTSDVTIQLDPFASELMNYCPYGKGYIVFSFHFLFMVRWYYKVIENSDCDRSNCRYSTEKILISSI